MGESRAAKRHKWRIPCEIVFEGGRQRSFVIDISESGVFVQTGVKLVPGSLVEIRLSFEGSAAPMLLRARVARAKKVPAQLTSVAHGGVGLQILDVTNEYLRAVRALGRTDSPLAADTRPKTVAAPAPPPARPRFRVRVKQCDGPRSRTLELAADSAEQARTLALREVGTGWDAVSADRIAS
jgi:hypothetical protein